jgi:hypothetical protein
MKRSSRSSTSWEAPVLGLLGLALALSSWALYRDFAAGPSRGKGGRPVGTIVYRQRQAERKYSGQVLWGSLVQNAPVYDLDAIRTADDSSATIFLEDKTSIELGEDSLVVLDLGGESKKLDFSGGTIRVDREGGSGALKVRTKAGELSLVAGAVALSNKRSAVSISVAEGSARFSRANAGPAADAIDIDGTKAVSVAEDGSAAEVPLEPVSPASGKELVAIGERAKIDFSWIGPAAFAGKLEIASDPGFAKRVESLSASGSAASATLLPGSYYWRLSSAGARPAGKAEGLVSRAFRLDVAASGPPRLIRPAGAASLTSPEGARRLVDFAWSAPPKAEGYRIEVSSEASFASKALSMECARAGISTDKLGDGRWYWRVVALFPAYGLEAPSAASSFAISPEAAKPKAAWRVDAAVPLEVSTLAAKAGALSLAWEETEGADSYRVTIARDEAFKETVYEGESRSSAATVSTSLAEGKYYARVAPVVAGRIGDPSEPRILVVTAPLPISTISPAEGSTLPPGSGRLEFSWNDPNRGKRYRLELAKDESFESIVATTVSPGQKASIEAPERLSGKLFWRVASIDSKGSTLVASGKSSFLIPASIATPATISPADGEVIDAFRSGSFSFAWKPSEGATEYRLSLYRATGGTLTPLREWTTDKTSVGIKSLDFLAVDAYAWKLVALGAPEGAGAERESPPATSYFKVVQSSQVGAPKLKIPEIIYVH